MHRLPVRRACDLDATERELLELCADDWTPGLIAQVLDITPAELRLRVRGLCARLGLAPPRDGGLPVDGARFVLVQEAHLVGQASEAA
jgi:hypothetical protein